jgi:predicted RNA methylase
MSRVLQYVENEQTSEFYPTPEHLARKMLNDIDWHYISTVLEPSAGKGDILTAIAIASTEYCGRRCEGSDIDVDCIEIDPNLRQILKYNFSEEKMKQYDHFDKERRKFFKKGIHIVHDDFLAYNPYKHYDLIVMNPPFSNGDRHLLKALDIQKNGGSIICLLNAETLRNPYTETRRELKRKLYEYSAQIDYIENAFSTAERRTGVEVALIKVCIPQKEEESDIYERMRAAEEIRDFDNPQVTDLEVTDFIKAAVCRFNVEVKSGLELIRQYRALVPYMLNSLDENEKYKKPILRLTDSTDRGYDSVNPNEYLKHVRMKYWNALLANPKFTGKLTSKLQSEYRERVDKLSNYDFTEFNIYTLSAEMNSQVKKGIEDEIIAMFDRLTEEHSWYPETQKNRHYFDGWATNKAHKIGKKVIIPCYGVYDEYGGRPRVYNVKNVLTDIERILNFLDGHMTAEVDYLETMNRYFDKGETKNIPLKYFNATFYKKGTIHLVFNCPELIERFNIYAAQNKAWLPPCYGKKKYKDMTDSEKAVVDSFQGEQAYNDVMAKAWYYLAPVTNGKTLMLVGA